MKNDAMQWRAGGVKLSSIIFCVTVLVAGLPARGRAQVNSGSNGSDGAFNPTATNTVINMADHPTGIYQYTAVNIPAYVTVTFIPNTNNTPVYWLVQSSCVISGIVNVSGQYVAWSIGSAGGTSGPGGWLGGSGGSTGTSGQGPGGGILAGCGAGNASYGSLGGTYGNSVPPGSTYGNVFLVPLLGGSGGGGATNSSSPSGGGGGGGAILIAAAGTIQLSGSVLSHGGWAGFVSGYGFGGGGGSGGAVRFVASRIIGNGGIDASGGNGGCNIYSSPAGLGRVRFDTFENDFSGGIAGVFTQGSQFIIIPTPGQGAQLTVASVAGVPVSASPTGVLATPDAVLSAQQANPVVIVVSCANLPLNTPITVTVKPATGAAVSAVGSNSTGTAAASTATVLINMPRGGGLIYATAATSN
jgi:hypothetical protein